MARDVGEKFGILDRVMLRGGAFKPRTRPTDWRGLGMKGIAMLDAAREDTGLPYVTEVMDHNLVEQIGQHADMLQIGTRNAQNFDLLEAAGRFGKPVISSAASATRPRSGSTPPSTSPTRATSTSSCASAA
jgi:3-deoxy-7-phosphoheptulonate synthase